MDYNSPLYVIEIDDVPHGLFYREADAAISCAHIALVGENVDEESNPSNWNSRMTMYALFNEVPLTRERAQDIVLKLVHVLGGPRTTSPILEFLGYKWFAEPRERGDAWSGGIAENH